MSLYLGGEVFDITAQPMQLDNHLFLRQGAGLQGHAVFKQVSVLNFFSSVARDPNTKNFLIYTDKMFQEKFIDYMSKL